MMTYKDALIAAQSYLARDDRTIFLGYGLKKGKAAGTLANISSDKIIETLVAENLMAGMALGLSLRGRLPVVYFERMDFMTNAFDAIVNHINPLKELSSGEFGAGIILRATVGNSTKPLFTGRVHTQDLSDAFRACVDFPVYQLTDVESVEGIYELAYSRAVNDQTTLIVEYKDLM